MKKLALLFALLFVSTVAASAQNPVWPYVFTASGYSCFPSTNCLNSVYIPQGWYGQVTEIGSATCTYAPPYAPGYQLNVFGMATDICVKFATLIQIIIYWDSAWHYAPGNPYATGNVIYAQELVAQGNIYAIPNNGAGYELGWEDIYEDCFTGNQGETGGLGGTC
jgi:hypothetical protein